MAVVYVKGCLCSCLGELTVHIPHCPIGTLALVTGKLGYLAWPVWCAADDALSTSEADEWKIDQDAVTELLERVEKDFPQVHIIASIILALPWLLPEIACCSWQVANCG